MSNAEVRMTKYPVTAEDLYSIGPVLRFLFRGLECALDISLAPFECERVFRDAETNSVSSKSYTFHRSPRCLVTGTVDEFEPETIRITLAGSVETGDLLRRVTQAAISAEYRSRNDARTTKAEARKSP